MIQIETAHPRGTFAPCDGCDREPRHVTLRGRTADEARAKPIDFATPNERHTLECRACGRATARHATLDAAMSEWGQAFAQATLPLRVIPHRRRAA